MHSNIGNKTKEDFSPETRPWLIGNKKLKRWLKKGLDVGLTRVGPPG